MALLSTSIYGWVSVGATFMQLRSRFEGHNEKAVFVATSRSCARTNGCGPAWHNAVRHIASVTYPQAMPVPQACSLGRSLYQGFSFQTSLSISFPGAFFVPEFLRSQS
jgi:hypothetical protein